MYGLIGTIHVNPERRDDFIAILEEGTGGMPGCLSYIIARDIEDAGIVWVTEVWETEEHHQASLTLPAVQAAIQRGRPMITGFGERTVTEPVGGVGLGR